MSNTIKASPTKDFFIQMLTKDIKLERAIIDLIDNSIDGAKSLRGSETFTGLSVWLNITSTTFSIKDNCGGFSLDTAINYAFMFGRPSGNNNEVKHSVGRFGVGMKRALFKIGKIFEVESKHGIDHFQVNVDVDDWSSRPDEWNFIYNSVDSSTNDLKDIDGTYIEVGALNTDVLDEFSSDIFIKNLRDEIERTLSFSLDNGLNIFLNNIPLKKSGLAILEYEQLKPYYECFTFNNVKVEIYAGIGKPSPDLAGWYIYCNDRLVLEKDKTNLTGWEGKRFGESNVQKFHHIYAMFRGIVFFSSDDAKALPMTTTKTGIDSNSPVYKAARSKMINSMTQVIAFLKSFDSDDQRNDVITASTEVDVASLKSKTYNSRFIYPTIQKIGDIDSNYTSISYKALKDDAKKVQKFFGISSNKEVGERTFQYFLKSEADNL